MNYCVDEVEIYWLILKYKSFSTRKSKPEHSTKSNKSFWLLLIKVKLLEMKLHSITSFKVYESLAVNGWAYILESFRV